MLVQRFEAPEKIRLDDIPTKTGLERAEAERRFAPLAAELSELQELLFAAGTHSLLVVLQGRDTAGKDGTLKAVAGALNPAGTRVVAFKVPTPAELAHDFLWRIHRETPGRGEAVFFNRSHYEDVLVVRVHDLAPEPVWKRRYDQIREFEALLTETGTIVVKFYLHISKGEQEKRLREREEEPAKAWKLNPGDWKERALWDDYTRAYEDAIAKCATRHAPWHVVPADDKPARNVAIAHTLVEALRPYKKEWLATLEALGARQKAALDALRQPGGA